MAGLPERKFDKAGREEPYPTFFGYSAWCIETGVRNDDPETMQACVEAGFLNPQCEAIGKSMVGFAKEKKATKVVAWLKKNGYQ